LNPKPNQILFRSRAVAINPLDWGMQMMGPKRFPFLKCPCVFSYDVAGEVIAVGSDVSGAKVGDRVLGLTVGPRFNDHCQLGAFQEYTLLADDMLSPILDRVSFEEACVIPLGLSTSASGMFEKDYLALPRPSVNPKLLGKTLLVWFRIFERWLQRDSSWSRG
jgi:NADPH:quinone reductase-like Zn-dependent oxidoreductase